MSTLAHILDQLKSWRGATVHPWVFTATHQTFQLRLVRNAEDELYLTMSECHSISFVEGWHLVGLTIERHTESTPERFVVRDGDHMTVECERVYLSDTGLIP